MSLLVVKLRRREAKETTDLKILSDWGILYAAPRVSVRVNTIEKKTDGTGIAFFKIPPDMKEIEVDKKFRLKRRIGKKSRVLYLIISKDNELEEEK